MFALAACHTVQRHRLRDSLQDEIIEGLEAKELGMLSVIALLPILILLLLGAIDLWVYADANDHRKRGTPVVFSNGFLTVDTPAAWFIGCLLLSIVFIPLYITIRGQIG
jgi:hypothetical protein